MIRHDDTDRAILRAPSRDADVTTAQLGRRLGLSQPATWRRIRTLKEAGVIRQEELILDPETPVSA